MNKGLVVGLGLVSASIGWSQADVARPAPAPAQAVPAQAKPAGDAQVPVAPTKDKAAPGKASQVGPPKGKILVAPQMPGGKPGGRMPGPVKPQSKPWEDFKLNPKTTIYLDFTEANPTSVLNLLSKASGITILKDPQFKSKLTLTTGKAVSLKAAFDVVNTVLGFQGYEFHKRGEYLFVERIPPPPQPAPPPPPPQPDTKPIVKVYKLKHASALQLQKIIDNVFGAGSSSPSPGGGGNPFGGGFSPGGFNPGGFNPGGGLPGGGGAGMTGNGPGESAPVKTTADEFGNTLVVFTSPQRHPQVEDLINKIDTPSDQPLTTEIFRLEHVTVEEALPVIKNVLVAQTPLGVGNHQEAPKQDNNPFFFRFGGSGQDSQSKGAQSAIGITQTNSIIVSATKENIEVVRKLIANIDKPGLFVGTTFFIPLQNAKASDVASLLTTVFAQRRNANQDDPFFFFFGDFNSSQNKLPPTDVDEKGQVVNVRDLSGKVTVAADPNTNGIVVTTQPSYVPIIERLVKQIDQSPQQVMIETIVVEANLDRATKLGVEWNLTQPKIFGKDGTSGVGTQNFGVKPTSGIAPGLAYSISAANYTAFLNTLQTDDNFHVLSTPRIVTSNNVKSEINVSQQVPYIVSQQSNGNGVTNYNYQFLDVGIVLDVTPRVTASQQVAMEVSQTANELQGFTTFNAPIINKRSAQATVWTDDGETIVLGGIIRNRQTLNESKIPLLGDIPLLGNLFKKSTSENIQTELMVFLTPHIVKNGEDVRKLRENARKQLSKPSKNGVKDAIEDNKIEK